LPVATTTFPIVILRFTPREYEEIKNMPESDTSVVSGQCAAHKHNEMKVVVSTISDNLNHTEEPGRNKGRRKTEHREEGEPSFCYIKTEFLFFFSSVLYPRILLIYYWTVSPVVGPGATWPAVFVVREPSVTTIARATDTPGGCLLAPRKPELKG
jgi:hypothetical protein